LETALRSPVVVAARGPEGHRAGSSAQVCAGVAIAITREEFDELVRAHQPRIYRVLLGIVRDPDAAETLTQECFLRAYRKRKSFRGESGYATWLIRIAVNLALDHGRSRRLAFWRHLFGRTGAEDFSSTAASVADPQATPERQLAAREELRLVWSTVERLPAQQRAAFVLRFAEEMSLEEVAAAMALKVGTVKAHLARAVGALRKRLKENGIHARTSDR